MRSQKKTNRPVKTEPGFSITNMNGQSGQEHYSYLNANGLTDSPRVFSITDMNGKAGNNTRYSLLCMNGI